MVMIVPSLYGNPRAWINAWARSAALEDVVLAFGGESHGGREVDLWLDYLDDFSRRWDFRSGRERNVATASEFSPKLSEVVIAAARQLGMCGVGRPPHRRYQSLVILGGLARSCLARPLHAARLMKAGDVTVERVVALATSRPLRTDESSLTANWFERPVDDEFDAMCAGVELAFDLLTPIERGTRPDGAVISNYLMNDRTPTHVVAVPSSDRGRARANTADTYAWLANESGWLHRHDQALIITTDIYVPYQHSDAMRMLTLPHGIRVDFVGIDPGAVDARLARPFTAGQYLQELRSAIRSLRRLSLALAQ